MTASMAAAGRAWTSATEEHTRRLGEALGRVLRPGDVVGLVGVLGAGKTTFVQGVALGLGVRGYVASPTFTLVREYQGRLRLYHVDLFRIDAKELDAIGFDDLLDAGGAVVVEWADRAVDRLPQDCLWVIIEGSGEQPRTLRVQAAGPESATLLSKWEAELEAQRAGTGD